MTTEPVDETLVHRLRAAGCVFAEDEARQLLDAEPDADAREALVRRRLDGEPLEHVVGRVDIAGLRLHLAPSVFVPRRRSEVLVRVAQQVLESRRGARVLDLCCGAGAIGAVIAARVPGVEVWASDIDPVAVACARSNLPPERVRSGDLFDGLPSELRGTFTVIVANAPYVPTGELALMPIDAREHEPVVARDGGADGLDLLRRITTEAPDWLAPGGTLAVEIGRPQEEAAVAIGRAAGLEHVGVVHADDVDGTAVLGVSPGR